MKKFSSRIVRGKEVDNQFDIEFWSSQSPAERVVAAWELSKLTYEISGKGRYEPRLYRHISRVIRR